MCYNPKAWIELQKKNNENLRLFKNGENFTGEDGKCLACNGSGELVAYIGCDCINDIAYWSEPCKVCKGSGKL